MNKLTKIVWIFCILSWIFCIINLLSNSKVLSMIMLGLQLLCLVVMIILCIISVIYFTKEQKRLEKEYKEQLRLFALKYLLNENEEDC